jgi:hypothetical protein
MKKLVAGALALSLLAASAPAMAGDLLYSAQPDSLTENLNGQPFWSAQAQCAGLFGAAAQHYTETGNTAAADEAKAQAMAFANDAIARLRKDRGISKRDAVQVIQPAVLKARGDGAGLLSNTGQNSTWNFARSSCLDIADASVAQARW